MSNMSERPKETLEKDGSLTRRLVSGAVAAGAALLAALLFCSVRSAAVVNSYDKAILAGLLAITIVAGARALEYPAPEPVRRRRAAPTLALQMARSWLLCFLAISAVFLLNDVVAKYDPDAVGGKSERGVMGISGTLTVTTSAETHDFEVAGKSAE
ncbi:hypothetical protein [Sphingopyxis sp. NJF-3]